MAQLVDRMLRAARLDASLYEEVEADSSAMGQATLVVVMSSIAGGLGTAGEFGSPGVIGFIVGAILSLIGWYLWSLITYLIGTRLLPQASTEADLGQLLRTLGFASTPGIVRAFGIIPGVGPIALAVGMVWSLIAMVIAVRQALDYTGTGRAIAVCLIGWIVQVLIILVPMMLLGFALGSAADPGAAA